MIVSVTYVAVEFVSCVVLVEGWIWLHGEVSVWGFVVYEWCVLSRLIRFWYVLVV